MSDRLNAEDPPTADEYREFDRLAEQQEIRQLAASSEDASLIRMVASFDQVPPAFWDGQDALLSVGGTVEPAGGSPSGSR